MKLATTTEIMFKRADGGFYSFADAINALADAGYSYLDASLWNQSQHGMPLEGDGWRDFCAEHKAIADSRGVSFIQSHGTTLGGNQWDDLTYPDREYVFSMMFRCIEATAILGAETMVLHPYNLPHDPIYDAKKAKDACIAYLAPYIEHAKKFGVRLAVENMVDFGGRRRRYCGGDINELIELIDEINDESVGICLDTGHANTSGIDPAAAIRLIGDRLYATHIDDNLKTADSHFMPFFGNIDWKSVMRALRDINYSAAFAFETGASRIPHELRPAWLKFTHEIGTTLLNMAK